MSQAEQLVKYKQNKQISKKSSFRLKIDNVDELKEFSSKKVQFLDCDAMWWIVIKKTTSIDEDGVPYSFGKINVPKFKVSCHLQTNENIWRSKAWSFFVSRRETKTVTKTTEKVIVDEISCLDPFICFKENSFLELKLEMTISLQITASDVPIQTFFDVPTQYKAIIANHKQLLLGAQYSDFTFVVHGKKIKVHKCILATASPVFDKLFSTNLKESRTNECNIQDIELAIFLYLLSFIYCGELPENLYERNIAQKLFYAAHYYQIEKLVNICKQVQHFKLSAENAEEIYEWAYTYELEDLKVEAWNIIKCDILEVCSKTKPPSPVHISSLIAKKKENDMHREKYRLGLEELETTVDAIDDEKAALDTSIGSMPSKKRKQK